MDAISDLVADLSRFGAAGWDERGGTRALTALPLAYADFAGRASDGLALCSQSLDRSIDREVSAGRLGLYAGWAGIGWMAAHLGAEEESITDHVDRLLTQRLADWPEVAGYDLISGIVGAGVYFLERLPADSARIGLTATLDALEHLSMETPDGHTWFTRPNTLPAWQRALAPNGYFNLGVAHGVPGVLSVLGKMHAAGTEAERVARLLRSGLSWLLAQHPDPSDPDLPSWNAPGTPRRPNRRMAWCYGPLGASAVVLEAARSIDHQPGIEWARTLALACANVPPAEAGVSDAGLCHGAAGNAQIFQRLAEREADPVFQDAADRWLQATRDYRQPGTGIGGYRMWTQSEADGGNWVDDETFLSGSGGVLAVLLTAATGIEPRWDRLLLLS